MNGWKRIAALLIAALMLVGLVACTTTSQPTDTDTQPVSANPTVKDTSAVSDTGVSTTDPGQTAERDFVLPERPVGETSGKTFTIVQHEDAINPFSYKVDSLFGEYAAARIAEVQETYGCTLEFSTVPYDDSFPSQMQMLAYTDGAVDLVFSKNSSKLRLALGTGPNDSLMVDLLTLDNILDFWNMEKWGDITAREVMMSGGHFYGVSPALWVEYTPMPYYTLVYNKDLLQRFNVPDLQEYWEKREWDRDVMVNAIAACYDDTGTDVIYGLSASQPHMIRATMLSTGVDQVIIDKINADSTVEWSSGLRSKDALEAFQWLKSTLISYAKNINNGAETIKVWTAHEPFLNGLSALCLTRPSDLFAHIVTDMDNFGLISWGAADSNVISGYYESIASIAIPTFAKNPEHSAFLMYDLFEGLGDVESREDLLNYYRETFFETDLDMKFLFCEGAALLQYSYWPNEATTYINQLSDGFRSASSMQALVERVADVNNAQIEKYIIPNKVALEAYRQNGYFD